MDDLFFVDSNVLLYRRDSSFRIKQKRADEWLHALWERGIGRLSVQVLNEFYVAVTQKLKPGMAQREAREEVRDFITWKPVPLSSELIERAFEIQSRYKLSYWDSLIIAAAQVAKCRFLLTEDLQDGQEISGIKVRNPFEHTPE